MIYYIFAFLIGLAFGSFGSVLIWRLQGRIDGKVIKSILFGRSHCPKCQKNLKIWELVPIVSYIWLGGKCQNCERDISLFYPLLEFFSGLIFVFSLFVVNYLGLGLPVVHFVFLSGINWLFLLLAMADILFFELNVYLWLLAFFWIILFKFTGLVGDFKIAGIGGIIFFFVFMGIYRFGKLYVRFRFNEKNVDGFGQGDVMVGVLVGMMMDMALAWNGYSPNVLVDSVLRYIILSCILGICFGLANMVFDKKQGRAIPFLPAMILAYYLMIYFFDFFMIGVY